MNRYPRVNTYLATISTNQRPLLDEIRPIFNHINNIQESVKRDRLHYKFNNGMWCYITLKPTYLMIGVSRGVWITHHYSILSGLFDEMAKVVGKIKITQMSDIQHKGIPELVQFIDQLPSGIGVKIGNKSGYIR